jgi:hypothetical protein
MQITCVASFRCTRAAPSHVLSSESSQSRPATTSGHSRPTPEALNAASMRSLFALVSQAVCLPQKRGHLAHTAKYLSELWRKHGDTICRTH